MCQFALTIPALERQKQEDLSSLQTSKSNLIHIQRANLSQKKKSSQQLKKTFNIGLWHVCTCARSRVRVHTHIHYT